MLSASEVFAPSGTSSPVAPLYLYCTTPAGGSGRAHCQRRSRHCAVCRLGGRPQVRPVSWSAQPAVLVKKDEGLHPDVPPLLPASLLSYLWTGSAPSALGACSCSAWELGLSGCFESVSWEAAGRSGCSGGSAGCRAVSKGCTSPSACSSPRACCHAFILCCFQNITRPVTSLTCHRSLAI